jgi:hypothetical protein
MRDADTAGSIGKKERTGKVNVVITPAEALGILEQRKHKQAWFRFLCNSTGPQSWLVR